ncbi:MAG: hypothetical protein IH623_15100 [Verrucomicrobia bacterium]|nr:hypothetical protein [Verrucomicrobiota bacterium]
MPNGNTPWPHAPPTNWPLLDTYIVTAGTYRKAHQFRGANRLRVLHRGLLKLGR